MQREEYFTPDCVNVDNVSALFGEASVSFEKRICEMAEVSSDAAAMAEELFEAGLGIYELLGFISDGMSLFTAEHHEAALAKNSFLLKNYLRTLSYQDKATFSSLFTKKLKEKGIISSESDFLHDGTGDSSIVYVKNRLADEAYDVFSESVFEATVEYAETFRDAAEAVSSGRKEYAILPLEEKDGARLAGIATLLFKYDLKIASVTPVFGFDGSADVKYALVAKHFSIPPIAEDDDRYLEIRLRADNSISLSALFMASEMLGATVYRINTLKFENEEGEFPYYTIVFRDDGSDFSELLVFLTLFAGYYTAIGIYKNLE